MWVFTCSGVSANVPFHIFKKKKIIISSLMATRKIACACKFCVQELIFAFVSNFYFSV